MRHSLSCTKNQKPILGCFLPLAASAVELLQVFGKSHFDIASFAAAISNGNNLDFAHAQFFSSD
jgi:hypothetical protein